MQSLGKTQERGEWPQVPSVGAILVQRLEVSVTRIAELEAENRKLDAYNADANRENNRLVNELGRAEQRREQANAALSLARGAVESVAKRAQAKAEELRPNTTWAADMLQGFAREVREAVADVPF